MMVIHIQTVERSRRRQGRRVHEELELTLQLVHQRPMLKNHHHPWRVEFTHGQFSEHVSVMNTGVTDQHTSVLARGSGRVIVRAFVLCYSRM
jgi:hypothetical protein